MDCPYDYKSLLGQYAKQVFDWEVGEQGIWCTIEFSNGDVHFVFIPNVDKWDVMEERQFFQKPIRELMYNRFREDIKGNFYYILVVGGLAVWFPVKRKIEKPV